MYTIIKSYFRNFRKQKLIYSITIGGFGISLAVLILIVSFIIEEKSFDRHFPNIDNLYRIKQADQNARIPKRIYQTILDVAPEIESLCLLSRNGTLYRYKDEKKYANVVSANESFLDIFSIEIIEGSREDLLQAKTDVIITEDFANEVFGSQNPIGEIIEFGDKEHKEVKAVIANPKKTSSLKYDAIVNLDQNLFGSTRGYNEEEYHMHDAVFVLNGSANPKETEEKLAHLLKPFEGYEETVLKIQAFKQVYFDLKSSSDSFNHANINMIRLLSWIALILLLLAIFNYINLTTAFNNERHKEICIRKTTGARSNTIFYQFIGESYLAFLIALFLSVCFAVLLSPLFQELFNREIDIFNSLSSYRVLVTILIIFLIIGGLSGLIPALSVARFNPIDLLQRKIKFKRSSVRGAINTVQFMVTLCLIISLITISRQIEYVKTKDVGFNKELLLELRLQGKTYNKASVIKEKLLKFPDILHVSGTSGRPFGTYSSGSGTWQVDSVEYSINNMVHMNTDSSFLATFELKLVKGRNFRPTDKNSCIINEKTYKHLQLDNLEGKTIWGSPIVGVVEDFHFKKMHQQLGFIQLRYNPEEVSHLNIRIAGNNIQQTLAQIRSTFKEFEPGITFAPRFYDEWINTMYQKEEKQAKAIKIYAILTIILSCLGLLGIAEYATIKRVKEIGIRKVNGAKVYEVLAMLNKDFVKWVAIAFVIACPIAYYAMNQWLENFAYKTTLSWWIFALAGMFALGIALLTVSWQSWRAATRNPVEALRYE